MVEDLKEETTADLLRQIGIPAEQFHCRENPKYFWVMIGNCNYWYDIVNRGQGYQTSDFCKADAIVYRGSHFAKLYDAFNDMMGMIAVRQGDLTCRLEIAPITFRWRVRVTKKGKLIPHLFYDNSFIGLMAGVVQHEQGVFGIIRDYIQDLGV